MGIRTIIFRGKRKDNGEWVYGYYFQIGDVGKLHYILTGKLAIRNGTVGFEQYEVIPESVSEFTGLTDKNGKKIFEGDIVKHDFGAEQIGVQYAVVEYDTKYASFMINPLYDWMYCDKNDVEIIGNIHDNPELLKGGV